MTFASVALLVDGDNVSADFATELLERADALGRVVIRRTYCNARNQLGWDRNPNFKTIHAGAAKNGADLLLAIDAIEFAMRGDVSAFLIASSDSDFLHLAHRLGELGKSVMWMGEAAKCSPDILELLAFTALEKRADPQAECADSIDYLIKSEMEKYGTDGENGPRMRLSTLGSRLKSNHGISKSNVRERKLSDFFQNRPHRFNVQGSGPSLEIVCLRNGFSIE